MRSRPSPCCLMGPPRSDLLRLGLALLAAAGGSASAQDTLLSAEEIIARLQQPPAHLAKGFLPRANPDAATRVCDAVLNRKLVSESGQRGEHLTRTLYVEAAPTVDLDVEFAFGEAALLDAGRAQLDQLVLALRDPVLAGDRFVLAGHTDTVGSGDFNDRLSCERALSVRRYLTQQGIASDRLVPMGFGFQKLKDPADPTSGKNRRVEVRKFTGLPNAQ